MNQEVYEDSQEILPISGGLHILLFDPEKSSLTYTKSMLKHAFYTVISTGEQSLALKLLKDNSELIELIMIDDIPQEMDCTTFIRKIKDITESIPIVLLSSKHFFLSASLLQIGACRVVSKPISSSEVKSLWKFTSLWRAKAYKAAVEEKAKMMPVDNIKKRAWDGGNKNVAGKKGKRVAEIFEKFDSDYGERDEDERGDDGKRSKIYTDELHRKCLELAENRNRISQMAAMSRNSNPFVPSSTFLRKLEGNAGKNYGKSSRNFGVQIPRANIYDTMFMKSDGSCIMQYPSMNFDLGFPTNRVLENPTTQVFQPRFVSNDLNRFSNLVDNQTSFLASNGEYMKNKQLSDSQLQALYTSSDSLNNLLKSLPSVNNNTYNIPVSSAEINEEKNAFSVFNFDLPVYNQGHHETVFGDLQEEITPVSEDFDEVYMDEFLKSIFEGSGSSSTPSSGAQQGYEVNVNHSKTSTPNFESFAENGSQIASEEDILNEIAREIQLEGLF